MQSIISFLTRFLLVLTFCSRTAQALLFGLCGNRDCSTECTTFGQSCGSNGGQCFPRSQDKDCLVCALDDFITFTCRRDLICARNKVCVLRDPSDPEGSGTCNTKA
ncbi:hypothetical protein FisN_12Lu001 [Fistulifera solaris]|uniref:TNFR-Cys domain-containing protein n=1 Tax=Fistulifera solaris TaxID=1519565 RepID=A0A1Z5KGL6_FISSO|nr:hypothetical protein FisN_12Lu001 [Fistulifera solaris]|eukprot:GAX25460.1 hypothetical protein FisN_12Lu001 [Fistulifera solaris]